MATKECISCGAVLKVDESNFYKSKRGKDGFINQCKPCRNKKIKERRDNFGEEERKAACERVKTWRRNHPEYVKNYGKQWTESGKAKEACRKWRMNNQELARRLTREWQINNPEKKKESERKYVDNDPQRRAEQYKKHRLKKKYGISLEDYLSACDRQQGLCYLCEQPTEVLTVDHDHACCSGSSSCGKCIRGLLCSLCNFMLGAAKDNKRVLSRAVDYLTSPPGLLMVQSEPKETPCP